MNDFAQWQKAGLSVLCVVLALVLIVLIFATTYVHSLLNLIVRPPDETLSSEDLATATESLDPSYTGPTVHQTDVTLITAPDPAIANADVINILLVGQDRTGNQARQRSDSMILCTFNTKQRTITLTSFMRDTYVYIPGHGNQKMNAAYMYGGFSLLNETLAVNFGIHVDGNVEVDFGGFKEIIDQLGGVKIELTADEAQYINTKLKSQRVSAGLQILDGEEALWYARNRSTRTSTGTADDFGRTERQRTLLLALIDAYKDQSLSKMLGLMYDILPMVSTNMTNEEMMSYVVSLFPMLAQAEISTLRIPTSDTYTGKYISGIGSTLIPDLPAIRDILKERLGA